MEKSAEITLYGLVEKFAKIGGKIILMDEVHKYPHWSREIILVMAFRASLLISDILEQIGTANEGRGGCGLWRRDICPPRPTFPNRLRRTRCMRCCRLKKAMRSHSCLAGFRLPTEAEWEQELNSWSRKNTAGAFASPLKLTAAGCRNGSNGGLFDVGSIGIYRSSTVANNNGRSLDFDSNDAGTTASNRGFGDSVRCIKD